MKKLNAVNIICVIISIILFNFIDADAEGLHTVDYNYINDMIGDKATGLGGAYCAISDDPSGAYYNPAGLVFAVDNQISLSVNNYKFKYIEFKSVFGDSPYTQDISSFYPSFFGVVQTLGSFKIALTILNVNNEILDQDNFFGGLYLYNAAEDAYDPFSYNVNYNITDNTLLGGLSLAHFFFSDSLSIGVTAYGLKRRIEQIQTNFYVQNYQAGDRYYIETTYSTEDIYGVMYSGGMQWMPLDILSLGVSAGSATILSHEKEFQRIKKEETNTEEYSNDIFTTSSESFTDDGMPVVVRTGVAVFPTRSLLVSADCIAHIGSKYYRNEVENTFNGALGVEYYIPPSLPIRCGVFTNFANTPVIEEGYTNQQMHVDMYGASLSLSWQTKSSAISLSGFYQTGQGQAQVFANNPSIQDVYMYMYSISLTGSAKY